MLRANVDRCCRDQSVQLKVLPDVVAEISARFSKFAFVLFCYITNHLMTGPLGNSEFCFPRISMFPSTSKSIEILGKQNFTVPPRNQSLSVNC